MNNGAIRAVVAVAAVIVGTGAYLYHRRMRDQN